MLRESMPLKRSFEKSEGRFVRAGPGARAAPSGTWLEGNGNGEGGVGGRRPRGGGRGGDALVCDQCLEEGGRCACSFENSEFLVQVACVCK